MSIENIGGLILLISESFGICGRDSLYNYNVIWDAY